MAWSISDLFPPWGDSGERPSDNFSYQGGDLVNQKHLDYLWDAARRLEDDIRESLSDIDSDGDGIVDAADTADRYKGNDIDSDGDGVVNAADNATETYKNTDLDTDYVNADGSGRVSNGDAGILYEDELANGETLDVYQATFVRDDGTAASSGTEMTIASFSSGGSVTARTTVLSGDGTLLVDETGDPLASWTNNTGSTQHVLVLLDNGHFSSGSGSSENMYGSLKGRIN